MPVVLAERTSTVYWTSRDELDRMFDPTNINQWADVENTANESFIKKCVDGAIADATDDVRCRLRGAPCGPITRAAPRMLRNTTTVFAAHVLYTARGVHDTSSEDGAHRLKYNISRAEKWLQKVIAGTIRIFDGDVGVTTHPIAVGSQQPYLNPFGPWVTPEQQLQLNQVNEMRGIANYIWWNDAFDMPFVG